MHFIWVSRYLTLKLSSYVSNRRQDGHFTWSSEPREGGLAAYTANSQYFKTLSIGPAPGNEPATSRPAVKHSTDWSNPAAVKSLNHLETVQFVCLLED